MFKILMYDESSDSWKVQATAYKRDAIDVVVDSMPDDKTWMLVIVLKNHGAKEKQIIKS